MYNNKNGLPKEDRMKAYQRLIEYVKIPTASDPDAPEDRTPSTQEQWQLAYRLRDEMTVLGLTDVCLDGNCYLFGCIPGNIPDFQGYTIGFIAHLDVSPDAPSRDVEPRIVHYLGGDIVLDADNGVVLRAAEFPQLANYYGDDLLLADGRTLLGADDKAGIAEIMTMAEILLTHPEIKHGPIMVGFTPDEEIGRGADHFDVARFGADFAYTVDGGPFGEINYETFNAAAARVRIRGRSIHPGEAKDKLINAAMVALEFDRLLPQWERPEHTERYEGFFHLCRLTAQVEQAELDYIVRDHDWEKLEQRLVQIKAAQTVLNEKYGAGCVEVELKEQYRNMAQQVLPHGHLLDTAVKAIMAQGGTPAIQPIRGGTDGSRLSYMGLPCPNLGTGSFNHHGRLEVASVREMDQVTACLVDIAAAYGQKERE